MKHNYIYIYLIIFTVLYCQTETKLIAQDNNDNQLAYKYYQNQEYDKAAVLFEKLYNDTKYKNYRDSYLNCLISLNEFDKAETFLKKEIKKNKTDKYLLIDLGAIYYKTNKINDARSLFEDVIKNIKNDKNSVITTANSFIMYQLYEYAEKTYIAGSQIVKEGFSLELGNLYYIQRDYQRMMREFLNYLQTNPQYITSIQNHLQFLMSNDIDESLSGIVENTLIERIQKFPNVQVLNQLLIWQYTQTGKFKVALNQLIAIDKRTKTGEMDLLEFGKILYGNNQLSLALECFEYLMNKGKTNPIYFSAYIEYLNVLYTKATSSLQVNNDTILKLETMLDEAISIVTRKDSYLIINALVNIKAFYLNKANEAIALINKSLGENRFDKEQEMTMRILLGDIYVIAGNQWDAILTYAYVEKNMPESVVAHKARYKKAQLAYFTGQFMWAQAQLDILKAGVSKLIANDAIELSMFIADNYNLDTTETTMQTFARADFYVFSKKYDKALLCLDSLDNLVKSHSLVDDIIYKKAEIYQIIGDYERASELYKKVFTDFKYDILADNALFNYALLQEKMKKHSEAKEAYMTLIKEHPSSIFTVEARKKIRQITQ